MREQPILALWLRAPPRRRRRRRPHLGKAKGGLLKGAGVDCGEGLGAGARQRQHDQRHELCIASQGQQLPLERLRAAPRGSGRWAGLGWAGCGWGMGPGAGLRVAARAKAGRESSAALRSSPPADLRSAGTETRLHTCCGPGPSAAGTPQSLSPSAAMRAAGALNSQCAASSRRKQLRTLSEGLACAAGCGAGGWVERLWLPTAPCAPSAAAGSVVRSTLLICVQRRE